MVESVSIPVGNAERVRMLIAHEALVSPREEPVGRSALGGRVADVDRYLPRRWTHCNQHRCFQPRRLVPGRCYRERWRADLGGLHEGHIKPVVGWCTHSGGACAGRHDVPGWSDCLDSRASTGKPVDDPSAGAASVKQLLQPVALALRSRDADVVEDAAQSHDLWRCLDSRPAVSRGRCNGWLFRV